LHWFSWISGGQCPPYRLYSYFFCDRTQKSWTN